MVNTTSVKTDISWYNFEISQDPLLLSVEVIYAEKLLSAQIAPTDT